MRGRHTVQMFAYSAYSVSKRMSVSKGLSVPTVCLLCPPSPPPGGGGGGTPSPSAVSPPSSSASRLRSPSVPAVSVRPLSLPAVAFCPLPSLDFAARRLRRGVFTEFDCGGWAQSLALSTWWTHSIVLNLVFRVRVLLLCATDSSDYRSVYLLADACTSWEQYGGDATQSILFD